MIPLPPKHMFFACNLKWKKFLSEEWRIIMSNAVNRSTEAIDPICGMKVNRSNAPIAFDARKISYYFCSSACRDEFQKNPERYATKRKSWWSRYLDRVRKVTDDKPMSCCH